MANDITRPSADEWTIGTYAVYQESMRLADERFHAERDRRYAEIDIEREKALKIKEEADKIALDLARQIQTYKDEKANELREQINDERGIYVTRTEIKPFTEYVISQQGRAAGIGLSTNVLLSILTLSVAASGLLGYFIG